MLFVQRRAEYEKQTTLSVRTVSTSERELTRLLDEDPRVELAEARGIDPEGAFYAWVKPALGCNIDHVVIAFAAVLGVPVDHVERVDVAVEPRAVADLR